MNILKLTSRHRILFVICLLGLAQMAFAQTSSVVTLRFANPQYDIETNHYKVDVEMKGIGHYQELFGMNLRFFYDAAELEFLSLENIHPSYALLGGMPKTYQGNADSGPEMFGFEESATYVNGAIQLKEGMDPLRIEKNEWVVAFEAHFSVPKSIEIGTTLCPSLVWDLKAYKEEGLFPGDNGVRLTLMENKPLTRQISAPCVMQSEPFNWAYFQTNDMPFGYSLDTKCFTVGGEVTASEDGLEKAEYALYQNFPNPFYNETEIEFVLPRAEEAMLTFYDLRGRILQTMQGDYKAGSNVVKIKRGDMLPQGGVLFYRLQTTEYTSKALKMTAIDR